MSKKILVTGGSGLLGSYLIRWFKQQGYTDISATYQGTADTIPVDIRAGVNWSKLVLPDKEAALETIAGHDWVIHSAGLVSYATRDKYRLLEINKTGTEHIVNACMAHAVSHMIYIGSIASLGRETDHVVLNEKSPWLDNEFSTGYGLSKYLGELEAWRGAAEGLNVSVVLPSVMLGAGDWHRSSLQIVNRVVHKAGWYPGGQTGFVDVRDVAHFTGSLLEKNQGGERWLLSATDMSYGQFYQKLADHLGLKKKFRLAPKWLARTILAGNALLKEGALGQEMINQAYGTFSYDAAHSLTVPAFSYRDMEETLRDVTRVYLSGKKDSFLPF